MVRGFDRVVRSRQTVPSHESRKSHDRIQRYGLHIFLPHLHRAIVRASLHADFRSRRIGRAPSYQMAIRWLFGIFVVRVYFVVLFASARTHQGILIFSTPSLTIFCDSLCVVEA